MTVTSNFVEAKIKDKRLELDGKVLSRPLLSVTDGISLVYGCDVDIGITAISGYNQSPLLVNANNTVLKNVPIARSNRDVVYAEVGSAVRLRRTSSGRFEIIGFSKEMPGTYKRYAVNLTTLTIGAVEDVTITALVIPFGDLILFGSFGTIPLGAIAVYRGTTLLEIRT